MILHGFFRSSAAYRVRIALNIKALPYETNSLHLRNGDQRGAAHLARNPLGLVPVLETDEGSLTQSLATLEYLDERFPEPPLLPANAVDRAHCRALAQIVACDIHPIDNLRVLAYLQAELGQGDAAVGVWFNHWIALGFQAIETILAADPRTGRFCLGDTPTIADIALVPQVFNAARYSLDLSPYPAIQRIVAACAEVPAFADAHPLRQPDAE